MVDAGLFKGKTKILTSTKSKEAGTVDPKMQISNDEYKEVRNVVPSRRVDMSTGGRQKQRRQSRGSHLGFC